MNNEITTIQNEIEITDEEHLQNVEFYNALRPKMKGGTAYLSSLWIDTLNKEFSVKHRYYQTWYYYHHALKYNTGYVYIIKGTHNGEDKYKIGKANDLQDRLKRFEVKIPFDIELIMSFFVREPLRLESELHMLKKEKRIAGEWFDLDIEDMNDIVRYGSNREIEDYHININITEDNIKKKKWKSDKDYIEYLEDILVMNNIKFDSRI